jgi:hypothetical protein
MLESGLWKVRKRPHLSWIHGVPVVECAVGLRRWLRDAFTSIAYGRLTFPRICPVSLRLRRCGQGMVVKS